MDARESTIVIYNNNSNVSNDRIKKASNLNKNAHARAKPHSAAPSVISLYSQSKNAPANLLGTGESNGYHMSLRL